MPNKAGKIQGTTENETPLSDAGLDMAPRHRYTPSKTSKVSSDVPRWLRFPPLSPVRRLTRTRFWPYVAILGPGIVAAAAGNDAGGIAAYAQTGAAYSYT